MTTGITAYPVAVKFLVKFAFAYVLVDDIAKGSHDQDLTSTDILNPTIKARTLTVDTTVARSGSMGCTESLFVQD
jgi:hypothetical protein